MSFTDPDYVAGILTDVLTAGENALIAAGRPVDRVNRFYGPPSWDCEMLTVWPRMRLTGFGRNTSGSAPLEKQARYTLDVNVVLLRCITALTAKGMPSAATVDADAEGYAIDMWTLQRAYTLGIIEGTLFASAECTVGTMTPFVPLNPSGGLSGMSSTIEVALGV